MVMISAVMSSAEEASEVVVKKKNQFEVMVVAVMVVVVVMVEVETSLMISMEAELPNPKEAVETTRRSLPVEVAKKKTTTSRVVEEELLKKKKKKSHHLEEEEEMMMMKIDHLHCPQAVEGKKNPMRNLKSLWNRNRNLGMEDSKLDPLNPTSSLLPPSPPLSLSLSTFSISFFFAFFPFYLFSPPNLHAHCLFKFNSTNQCLSLSLSRFVIIGNYERKQTKMLRLHGKKKQWSRNWLDLHETRKKDKVKEEKNRSLPPPKKKTKDSSQFVFGC